MNTLQIRKKSDKVWVFIDSVLGQLIVSKFYFVAEDNIFQIVSKNVANHNRYDVPTQITLYDDTDAGTPETFANIVELSLRLEELRFPAYNFTDASSSITGLIQAGTNVTITGSGTPSSPYIISASGGSGSTPNLSEVLMVGGREIFKIDDAEETYITVIADKGKIIFIPQTTTLFSTLTIDDVYEIGDTLLIYSEDGGHEIALPSGSVFLPDYITSIYINYSELVSITLIGNDGSQNLYTYNVMPYQNSSGASWGSISGTLADQTDLQTALNGKKNIDVVISSNTTASNDTNYSVVANTTLTDPTPTEGKGYMVTVINGTATIGGVGYSVGQKVFRHYHSGSWRTFVYPSTNQLETFLRDETLLKGYICLTPSGISSPNNFKDVTYSSSPATGYVLQNSYSKTGAIAMVGFQSTAVAGTVGFKRRNDAYNFSNTNAYIWQKIEFDSNVSGARFHHILSNNYQFTAPTNVEPNTIINCVGFCKLSTSGNLHVVHNDNTGTATTIDLGASFPANNSGGNKRYLLGIQIKASSYVLTVIEINTTTNALTTNIYTTEVSSDIPSRTLTALQLSTMITNNATASNATYLDGGFSATNII